jgi:hypothetical protein
MTDTKLPQVTLVRIARVRFDSNDDQFYGYRKAILAACRPIEEGQALVTMPPLLPFLSTILPRDDRAIYRFLYEHKEAYLGNVREKFGAHIPDRYFVDYNFDADFEADVDIRHVHLGQEFEIRPLGNAALSFGRITELYHALRCDTYPGPDPKATEDEDAS